MTDSFIIRVDTAAIFESLTGLEQIQLPFAMSLGLNRVANIGQKAERDRLTAVFKLRRAPWILQGVYISKADRAQQDPPIDIRADGGHRAKRNRNGHNGGYDR